MKCAIVEVLRYTITHLLLRSLSQCYPSSSPFPFPFPSHIVTCLTFLYLQECDDPCCNPRTCRPTDGAQCTKGECCSSTCQFKAYGTRCRSASGQCGIEEYCSGESSECPTDVYRQDGTTCNNNQAFCFSGECQTHDDQCQYHFGTGEQQNTRNGQCFWWANRESLSLSITKTLRGTPTVFTLLNCVSITSPMVA